VPVLIGSGVALGYGRFSWWRALLALVVALALQVGVNFANDYSDGIRGSDERRVGPVRLVAAGLAPPRQVLLAAFGCFVVAGVAGLALAAVTSWWLAAVGAACIAAAWFYTGGPKPYGYSGLGEVFVSPVDCILSDTTIVQPDVVYLEYGRSSLASAPGHRGRADSRGRDPVGFDGSTRPRLEAAALRAAPRAVLLDRRSGGAQRRGVHARRR